MRKNMDNDFIKDFIFLYKLIYLLYYKFIIYMLKNCKNQFLKVQKDFHYS